MHALRQHRRRLIARFYADMSHIDLEGVTCARCVPTAAIAQLGERQTEDLKVPGSIPGLGKQQHCADAKQKLWKQGVRKVAIN